jgi:hypothetical protein
MHSRYGSYQAKQRPLRGNSAVEVLEILTPSELRIAT